MPRGNLVINRRDGQSVWIGDTQITVDLLPNKGNQIRLCINAPTDVRIVRGELKDNPIRSIEIYWSDPSKRWYAKVNGIAEPLYRHYDMIGIIGVKQLKEAVIAVGFNYGVKLSHADVGIEAGNLLWAYWVLEEAA
mgnify:CR=1 FL=1